MNNNRVNSNKFPLEAVRKGHCSGGIGEVRIITEENKGVRAVYSKNIKSCPKMYECSKIRMVPLVRALRRCTAEEAMSSVCAGCAELAKAVTKVPVLLKSRS